MVKDVTKVYIATQTALTEGLAAKVAIAQGTENAGKMLKVNSSGDLALADIPTQTNANWSETTTTSAAFIQNKPFQTIGTGLTVTEGVLSADTQLHFEVMAELPTASADYKQTIALILKSTSETGNVYDEYACVNTGTTASPTWKWERIGDLKGTVTQSTTAIVVNGTTLQTASDTQIGLMSAADHVTLTGAQATSNLVKAWQTTVDDTHYPSEKLVKAGLDAKVDDTQIVSSFSGTTTDTNIPSEKLVKSSLDAKLDDSQLVTAWSGTASDTAIPSEKLVKTELDKKEVLTNKKTSISSASTNDEYPSAKAVYTYAEPVIATKNTAFNKNFETTASNIKMDGTASVGTLETVAKADHVHPTDTTRIGFDGSTRFTIGVDSTGLYYLPSE